MVTDVLTTWSAVRALAREWNPLLERSNANTIFLTWEWIVSWAEAIGEQAEPFVITVRDDAGQLMGLAPFYVADYRLLRTVSYRVLRIMGDYPTGGEYGDWILDNTCAEEISQCLLRVLEDSRAGWDCIWMPNMNGWNGAAATLEKLCRAAGMIVHHRSEEFSSIRLPNTWDEFMNMLSQGKRKKVRQEIKRLTIEPVAKTIRCTEPEQITSFLKSLYSLHHSRWQTVGEAGVFVRKPAEAEFYRRFVPRALERGWLRFYALSILGEFKAVQIGYVYGKAFHALQEGFDGEAFKGVGNALRANIIRSCIEEEQLTEYDFLGGTSEHKRRWAAEIRMGAQMFVGRRTLKNALIFAKPVWPTGRYFRPKVNMGTDQTLGGIASDAGSASALAESSAAIGKR